jgi:hypothetical protein
MRLVPESASYPLSAFRSSLDTLAKGLITLPDRPRQGNEQHELTHMQFLQYGKIGATAPRNQNAAVAR